MKINIVKESLLKPNKKFTLLSAFITLLNDRLSESILLPILPSFVLLFDSKASTYGLLSCTYQLAQFTASPFIGLMSDSCLLYTSPSPRDLVISRMPSSA